MEAETDVRCILIGTIYKEMKLKPNILEELTSEAVTDGVQHVPSSRFQSVAEPAPFSDLLSYALQWFEAAISSAMVTTPSLRMKVGESRSRFQTSLQRYGPVVDARGAAFAVRCWEKECQWGKLGLMKIVVCDNRGWKRCKFRSWSRV